MKANELLWGKWIVALIVFVGIYLSFRTGFIQITRFRDMLKNTICSVFKHKGKNKKSGGVTPFQAVSTALAGTIGTGSIAGIATAVTLGGPGTVFWMWISALLGMATKYSEILLSVHFREKDKDGNYIGGPMFYIEKGTRKKWLSVLFCIFAICGSFGIGNTVQSNAISEIMRKEAGISPWITGTVLCIVATMVILGGISAIASVNEKLVPFMAVFYIGCSVAVLAINREYIAEAFLLILKNAFTFDAALGTAAWKAIRYGFARGIFSNEAGLGSAPIAHAAADTPHPAKQGLWGIFEVFFTTVVICTLTALVIITSGLWESGEYNGAVLSAYAFSGAIGKFGRIGVSAATVLFALSSILGWAYYGEVCVAYLWEKSKKAVEAYRIIYVAFVFVGAVSRLDAVWNVSELMNALMALPNLMAIILLGKKVKEITQDYFKKQ